MEHLVKLLRDSYDLQENKPEKSAYWHLRQKVRSEIKKLTLTDVVSEFFCEDEDLEYSSKKCKEQCDGCKWIENL